MRMRIALENKLTLLIQQVPANSPWFDIKTACDTRQSRECGCEVDVTTNAFKVIADKSYSFLEKKKVLKLQPIALTR